MPGPAFQKASSPLTGKSCDVAVIGGGLAAIMTAYRLQKSAFDEGRDLKILLVADKINAPALAGSQIVRGIEGFFEPDQRQPEPLDAILRDGQQWLEDTIEQEKIECRLTRGYEIKGHDSRELAQRAEANVGRNIYRSGEILDNTDNQTLHLPGYAASSRMECAGQVNAPELLGGLLEKYKAMGGEIALGARYLDHNYDSTGGASIQTSEGTFHSKTKPVIATGARHMSGMPDFPAQSDIIYTMAMTLGPLDTEDARKLASGPVAFCNVTDDQNMLWGSLDSKNMLTLGYGDTPNVEDRDDIERQLTEVAEGFFPGLTEKYPRKVLFGEMLCTPNLMPVVGETDRSYLMTGWGGRGIVPAAAAARAVENAMKGDRSELELFEKLQPGVFGRRQPAPRPHAVPDHHPGMP